MKSAAVHSRAIDAVVEHVQKFETNFPSTDDNVPGGLGEQRRIEKARLAEEVARAGNANRNQIAIMSKDRHEWANEIDAAVRVCLKTEALDGNITHMREAKGRWPATILGNETSKSPGENPEVLHQQLGAIAQNIGLIIVLNVGLNGVLLRSAGITEATLRVVVVDPVGPVGVTVHDRAGRTIPHDKALSHSESIHHIEEMVGASVSIEIDEIP